MSPTASEAEVLARVHGDLEHGRLNEAHEAILAFVHDHPHSADGTYLLGEICLRRNEPRQSLEAFTRAAALRPPTGQELRLVGLAYVLLADYVDATHWLEQAVKLSPEDGEAWYALGRVKYTTGDFHAAELDFLRALRAAPGSVKTQNNLGLAYAAQNKPKQALDAYREAIRLQDKSATKSDQPLLNYGTLLLERGEPQVAIDSLSKAIAIAPSSAICHETLGRALLQAGQIPQSVQEFERAVTIEPSNPRFHFELGKAYRKAGAEEQAEAEYRRSAQLYGSHSTPPN